MALRQWHQHRFLVVAIDLVVAVYILFPATSTSLGVTMPSSTLPAAFSIRQNLPSSASSIKYPLASHRALPTIVAPHPSSVRHRLRAVLPETLKDAEVEPLSTSSVDPLSLESSSTSHTATDNNKHQTCHQPTPALQQVLSKGMPAESVLLLNVVAVIWGSQHPVIKMVVDDCDASAFTLVRFCFAAIIASIFAPPWNVNDNTDGNVEDATSKLKLTWRWGAEMGLWMFLGYAFQSIGLEYTTAQRSGFLLYLNVKFVPFFARILFGREISVPTWFSAFIAVFGTALLSWEGTSIDLNVGDLWSIAAAATSAMFILRLEAASAAVSDSAALNAACLWVVTAASVLWTLGQGLFETSTPMETIPHVWDNVLFTMKTHPFALVYLSGVTTALANYIQTRGQRNVSAERASVIYAMDPVYGAVFSYFLLGERLTSTGIVGAALITIAAATNAFLDLGKPSSSSSSSSSSVSDGEISEEGASSEKEETNGASTSDVKS